MAYQPKMQDVLEHCILPFCGIRELTWLMSVNKAINVAIRKTPIYVEFADHYINKFDDKSKMHEDRLIFIELCQAPIAKKALAHITKYRLSSIDFVDAYNKGLMHIAEYLHDAGDNTVTFEYACRWKEFDLAKWIYKSKNKKTRAVILDHAFIDACKNNNFELAQWLYNLDHIDGSQIERALSAAYNLEKLAVVRRLRSVKNINQIIEFTREKGHLEIAKWLYDLHVPDPQTHIDIPNFAGSYDTCRMIEWLEEIIRI